MNRYFTKTFFRFFVGFVAIITIAFGIIVIASNLSAPETDNIAAPSSE
ncbi:MAG: hypothetical protein Q8P58_02790 [Candidatus Adlerbacteria bacterium]|nr:hypothetical protein [Candidatus Adlerbacteria bacterium]